MGETVDSSESFLRRQWEGYKEFWSDRFSIIDNYSTFIKGLEQPLSWSASDVEEFIASDPVHGPALKTAREAVSYGAVGSLIGAVSTAGFAWKYSRSLHGAARSFGAGAVFGWTFGHEISNHYLQLYRIDTMGAQVKFLEWQQRKTVLSNVRTGMNVNHLGALTFPSLAVLTFKWKAIPCVVTKN